ncbi:S49 family peptidase [Enterovirga sp.]|uniref:S49 family peptidase n=1 Tax=Enterovirga sp. TaxID=2026350 RepID=UPI002D114574|nr:S49 family peptidase [Enterovirga sp.]HMO31338.1 S49 family peptidase [Enterovirga sp.]
MTYLARLADQVLNRPLLLHPAKLETIAGVLSRRIGLDIVAAGPAEGAEASRFVGTHRRAGGGSTLYRTTEAGTAIVEVHGSLVNRGAWLNAHSGLTSYEGIKAQISAAGADPAVKSVLLDMDSPGGQAVGAFETADAVRALAAQKPVVALIDGMAASAAYAIASAASRIVTIPTGIAGSIGVVVLHADFSRALDKEGITTTLIHAGAKKADAHPTRPLSEDAKADLQAEVDSLMSMFVETVGRGRGSRLTARAARATEAAVYFGAEAVKAGLADAVGTLEQVLADLDGGRLPAVAGGRRLAHADWADGRAAAAACGHAGPALDLFAAGYAEGLAAALSSPRVMVQARQEARAHVFAVLSHDAARGQEKAALNLMSIAPDMPSEDVIDFLKTALETSRPTLGARAKDAPYGLVMHVEGRAPKPIDVGAIYARRAEAQGKSP